MQELLDTLAALDGDPIDKCSVAEARAQPTLADAVRVLLIRRCHEPLPAALTPDVRTSDHSVPGATGPLAARVYSPVGRGPFPVIVYFHGGGWVIADLDAYDGGARGLAHEAGAVVVSIDYRRAPEAKFPAAWDDALAAWRWVADHREAFGGDSRPLALAGESAGGCLAIATAITARDAGLPMPVHVLAVYPVAQAGSFATPSYVENAGARPLSGAMMSWFFDKLLRADDDRRDPRLDLVHADLHGLPPVTIVNASVDPLRSDGAMLEDALQDAGVAVERRDYAGVTHEFFGAAAVLAQARDAQRYAGRRLRASFAAAPRPSALPARSSTARRSAPG
jgi:acetyl esterase/lipase